MRLKYSIVLRSFLRVVESCIRICMIQALDYDANMCSSAIYTSTADVRPMTCDNTGCSSYMRSAPSTYWSLRSQALYSGLEMTFSTSLPSIVSVTLMVVGGVTSDPSTKPRSWWPRRIGSATPSTTGNFPLRASHWRSWWHQEIAPPHQPRKHYNSLDVLWKRT